MSGRERSYLDYNATAPMRPEVVEAVARAAELRMRMQHDADRRALLLGRLVPSLDAAGGPGEDNLRHGFDLVLRRCSAGAGLRQSEP